MSSMQAKNNFLQELNQMRCYTRFGIGAMESAPTNGLGKVGHGFIDGCYDIVIETSDLTSR